MYIYINYSIFLHHSNHFGLRWTIRVYCGSVSASEAKSGPLLRFGRGVGPRSPSPGAAKYLADAPGALKTEGEKKQWILMVINSY